MGHVFQVEWLGKYPSGCSFGLLSLSKLANEMERKNGIYSNLFIKIKEVRRKSR